VWLQAAELFVAGLKPPQVARALRVSWKSAYAWYAAWSEDQRWTPARTSVLLPRRFHVRFSQPQFEGE
jgi:hypothetical protein